MLKQKNFPRVLHFDGAYNDYSFQALSYGRDSFLLPMSTSDYLYFGKEKNFPMIFVEMAVANSVANTLTVEYYNGTDWAALEVIDDTKGLTRSGSIQFSMPSDWAETTVGGFTNTWIRIKSSEDLSSTTAVQGINILFSDDLDLEGIYPGVNNYKASTEASFVLRHEAARNDIVQAIRNRGFVKRDSLGGALDYDAWDFLEYEQVGRWSTYLALKNIFSSLQSKEDGLYKQKAEEYSKEASDAEVAFYLTLDKNNDGKVDQVEKSFDISSRTLVRS